MRNLIEVSVTPHMVRTVADRLGLSPEEVTDEMLKPFLLDALRRASESQELSPAEDVTNT